MQVFISYSRVDKAFAGRLADDLRTAGFSVWLDLQSIPHGSHWDLEVQRGLENSDVMLVLLSPTSSASENVQDEWNYFIEKKRRIIPVMIQPNEVPFRLSRRQRVDFIGKPYEQAFSELLNALNENVPTEEADRASSFLTRTINLSWGPHYSAWTGLSPVTNGQVHIAQADLRLIAPNHLPILIPVVNITDAEVRRLPWDSYIVLHFVNKAARQQELMLMGTERKSRSIAHREFLGALGLVTGKTFKGAS